VRPGLRSKYSAQGVGGLRSIEFVWVWRYERRAHSQPADWQITQFSDLNGSFKRMAARKAATVHCATCSRWFCDVHAEDEEWHPSTLPPGEEGGEA